MREEEADAVREAYKRVAGGEAIRRVAASLRDRGFTGTEGTPLRPHVLRRILQAPRYAGLRQHRGEVVGDAEWPAIVDRSTWEAVQARLRLNQGNPGPRESAGYPLQGLLRCSECGAPLIGAGSQRRNPSGEKVKIRQYACRRHDYNGCGKVYVRADGIERAVSDMFIEGLAAAVRDIGERNPGTAAVEPPQSDSERERDRLLAELDDIDNRLDDLARLYAEGSVNEREWLQARERLDQRRQEVAEALEQAEPAQDGSDVFMRVAEASTGDVSEGWEQMPWPDRRTAIEMACERVEVLPAQRSGRASKPRERVRIVLAGGHTVTDAS